MNIQLLWLRAEGKLQAQDPAYAEAMTERSNGQVYFEERFGRLLGGSRLHPSGCG